MSQYFSRLTLNSAASARALLPLLNPCDPTQAADAHHRLIWSVFSDSHARTRDFIWRYDGSQRFFTLSSRPPVESDLFLPPETKVFEPNLRPGDELNYVLCANATRARKQADGRSQRVDVVMDLLHGIKTGERAESVTNWYKTLRRLGWKDRDYDVAFVQSQPLQRVTEH